jgi:hypothetical protein
MSVGGLLVFAAGPGLAYDAVVERVRERLHLLPRYRQRLRSPAPGIANPAWIDDEDFDLGRHVRVATLPSPGDDERLGEFRGARAVAAPGPQPPAVGADHRRRPPKRPDRDPGPDAPRARRRVSRRRHRNGAPGPRRPSRSSLPPGRRLGAAKLRPHPASGAAVAQPAGPCAAAAVGEPAARAHRPEARRRGAAPGDRRPALGDGGGAGAGAHPPAGAPDAAQRRDRPQPPLRDRSPRPRRPEGRRQAARGDGQRRRAGDRHRDAPPLPGGGGHPAAAATRRASSR